jgi:glycerophosphoryl diester phosphodiesterase
MKTRIIAHRGGASMWPENTLMAFDQALRLGCDGVELDLQRTKDNELVVHHDADLRSDSTCRNGEWIHEASPPLRLEDMTYRELTDYEVGICRENSDIHQKHPHRANFQGLGIPKFSEVLEMNATYEKTLFLMAEIKTDRASTSKSSCQHLSSIYARQIADIEPENIVTLCFDWRCLSHLASLLPDTPLGFTTQPVSHKESSGKANSLIKHQIEQMSELAANSGSKSPLNAWNAWHGDINAETAAFAHDQGLAIYAWTVNFADDMQRLFDLGIHSLMTDRPDIALKQNVK